MRGMTDPVINNGAVFIAGWRFAYPAYFVK
ncbi:Uncharacterised protein [Enterobacter cloacae]|nr:Uncharacterised protein [Enterobacter cloacae]